MEAGDLVVVSGTAAAFATLAGAAVNAWDARRRARREEVSDERDRRDREIDLLLDVEKDLEDLRRHVQRIVDGRAGDGADRELTTRARRVRLRARRVQDDIRDAAVAVTYECEGESATARFIENGGAALLELDVALNEAHARIDTRLRELEGRFDEDRRSRPRPI